MKKLLILLLTVLLTSVAQAQTAEPTAQATSQAVVHAINSVSVLENAPLRNEKVELVADIDATFTNPYDPDDIRVDGRFDAPSGASIIVPGFYYRDYQYSGGTLTPTDNWSWRVRFTPTEVGTYHYQVMATTAQGTVTSETGTFNAADSDNPGFIRLDSRNPRYFAFDNGKPYFPIGEDMGWSDNLDPLADYQKWLGDLSQAGGNFVRVWMPPWGFSVEWSDTGLGNYDKRQGQAYQLDRVMDMLDQDHVYMMLSLINHGQFSTTQDPEWDQNPYNAANGGPCAQPSCFATDPTAIKFWNQRLRYIAARWGYSTNIMAWEWWNEINWTQLSQPDILAPWIAQSAAYLRTLDPYQHLITHDGSAVNNTTIWNQSTIDFTQDHRYNMQNLLISFKGSVTQWLQAYPTKPFLVGEFGDPLAIDNFGLLLHLGLWSAPMNGSGGSGMTWYWDDYVDRLNLYDQFKGIAAFFRDEDMGARQWQPTTAKFSARTSASIIYGVQASDEALLWVVSQQYNNSSLQKQYDDALRQAILTRNQAGPAYSFEGSTDGWALAPSSFANVGKSITSSSDQADDGTSSLAVQATYTGDSPQQAVVFVRLPSGTDWSAHTTASLDIYAPQGATGFNAQVYLKTGSAETEANSQHFPLKAGQWNTVTVQLDPLGDTRDVRELGVKIGTDITVFDGTFYIDKVVFGSQPNVTFSFPDVESRALNVTGLKPGNYTVEIWDTMAGKVISTTPVTSGDGTVPITLPTFQADLAIKVKPTTS